jgi:hypothetical protein
MARAKKALPFGLPVDAATEMGAGGIKRSQSLLVALDEDFVALEIEHCLKFAHLKAIDLSGE